MSKKHLPSQSLGGACPQRNSLVGMFTEQKGCHSQQGYSRPRLASTDQWPRKAGWGPRPVTTEQSWTGHPLPRSGQAQILQLAPGSRMGAGLHWSLVHAHLRPLPASSQPWGCKSPPSGCRGRTLGLCAQRLPEKAVKLGKENVLDECDPDLPGRCVCPSSQCYTEGGLGVSTES